jgi:hypothetical protein
MNFLIVQKTEKMGIFDYKTNNDLVYLSVDGQVTQVNKERLLRSEYYDSMINMNVGRNPTVEFPPKYNDVADLYLDYLAGNFDHIKDILYHKDIDAIVQLITLADFLADDYFLRLLCRDVCRSGELMDKVVPKLHWDLQREFKSYCSKSQ